MWRIIWQQWATTCRRWEQVPRCNTTEPAGGIDELHVNAAMAPQPQAQLKVDKTGEAKGEPMLNMEAESKPKP